MRAGLTWQPLGMLNLSGDLTSTRDLRIYPDSSPLGRLAYSERRFLLGIPVGVERDRSVTTALQLTPKLASWLRPRLITSSNFVLSRTLSSRDPVRADGDSGAFILPQTLNNTRTNELGAAIDFARGLRFLVGDSSGLGKAMAHVRPIDASTRLTRSSTYDLTAFDPGLKYQLALGGLESFLRQEGADARGVSDTRTATVASGADLPYGVSFTLSHALTRTTRLQRVGEGFVETESNQREWPVGNVRWSHTFSDRRLHARCASAPPSATGRGRPFRPIRAGSRRSPTSRRRPSRRTSNSASGTGSPCRSASPRSTRTISPTVTRPDWTRTTSPAR